MLSRASFVNYFNFLFDVTKYVAEDEELNNRHEQLKDLELFISDSFPEVKTEADDLEEKIKIHEKPLIVYLSVLTTIKSFFSNPLSTLGFFKNNSVNEHAAADLQVTNTDNLSL